MKNRVLLMVAMLAGMCLVASAQSNIFLKAMGANGPILGEAKVTNFENQVSVVSYSMGISSCAAIDKPKAGNCPPVVSELSFMIQLDRSVNEFRKMLLLGEMARSMEFSFVKSNGETNNIYYKIKMENVLVSSLQESSAGEPPFISISIKGARIAWGYAMQNQSGMYGAFQTFAWDVEKNKPWDFKF